MFALYSIHIISVFKISFCRNIYTYIKFYKIGRNLCYMYNLDFFFCHFKMFISIAQHALMISFIISGYVLDSLNMQIKLKSWDFRVTGDDITH